MFTVYVQLRDEWGELKIKKHKTTKYPTTAKKILNKYPRGFVVCADSKVILSRGF